MTPADLERWVCESCRKQGLSVPVTDGDVLNRLRVLLRAPHGRDPAGVKLVQPSDSGTDDRVIEDRVDDRSLPA